MKQILPEPSEGTHPAYTLTSDSQGIHLVFKLLSLWYFVKAT